MFDKFGEMDSYKEINELAENLFNEGDTDSLRVMAKENGIPDDFVEMYLEGAIPELCDSTTAALGKLDVEAAGLKLNGLMLDWVEYIKGLCMEEVMIAHQVRKHGIGKLATLANAFKAFTELITGNKASNGGSNGVSEIAASAADAGDSLNGASDAASNLTICLIRNL